MTGAATRPASSASVRHRRHAGPGRAVHPAQARQRPRQVPARPAQGERQRLPPGPGPGFPADWRKAAQDTAFQQAQNDERDRVYFNPAVAQGKTDGIGVLGQFTYYDAIVMHGDGGDSTSFSNIRRRALAKAEPPARAATR